MSFYPVNIDLTGRLCVVIGGGRVAERKVRGLLSCNAEVQIISPDVTPGIEELSDNSQVTLVRRAYQAGDLEKAFLIIAATDDIDVQHHVHLEAEEREVLINVADVPQKCNFILPATVRRGDFTVSISTGGKSPALAKQLRMELEKQFGLEYEILVELLGALRNNILSEVRESGKTETVFHQLIHKEMVVWIKEGNWEAIENHIKSVLGNDFDTGVLKKITDY